MVRCGVCGAAVLLWAGCIIVPVNYRQYGSRRNVNESTASRLQPGVTTREEVFLMLGEPDYASDDGRRLGYGWSKVRMLVMVGGYAGGWVGEATRSHLLRISFDAAGRVAAVDVVAQWGEEVSPQRADAGP